MDIETITAAQARPLRHAVLRPYGNHEDNAYPGDDDPDALHIGLFHSAVLVATASVLHQAPPGAIDVGAWRLRGVAVHESYRNHGRGAELIAIAIAYVNEAGGTTLWGNARREARNFYEREGFHVEGELADDPVSGGHYFMVLKL